MNILKEKLLLTCLLLILNNGFSQNNSPIFENGIPILSLQKPIPDSIHLLPYSYFLKDSTNQLSLQNIQNQGFTPLSILTLLAPSEYSHNTYWLRTEIQNKSLTDTLFLSYNLDIRLDSLTIFITENGLLKDSIRIGRFIRPHPQPKKVDYPSNRSALITLPPSAHYIVFAKIKSLAIIKNLHPILFQADREISYFIWKLIPIYAWNLCFMGILAFMTFLTFGSYFQHRHRAYLYYGLYIMAHLVSYFCDFESYEQFQYRLPTAWTSIYYRVPVYFAANLFYVLFTTSFLDIKKEYPKLYLYFQFFIGFYVSFMVIERFLVFYDYHLATEITNYLSFVNAVLGLVFQFYIIWSLRNNKLARFLLIGTLFYVLGILGMRLTPLTSTLWNNTLIWNQLGILIELLFFWLGLAYKSRFDASEKERLALENKELHFQKQLDLARLRNQIAQDIHDEIGSGLTKISLNAQVTARMATLSAEEYREKLSKIDTDARKLGGQMREVVFAINPDYDNFDDLQAYFKEYAREFWVESDIEPIFLFEKNEVNPVVSPKIKRQLLLIFKEALNNIAKHAHAKRVNISFKLDENEQYHLKIEDDGMGIELDSPKIYSKGLSGMKQRADDINAIFTINSDAGKGTSISVIGKVNP